MLGKLLPTKRITDRLQHGRTSQRVRGHVREQIRHEPALRLLPALLSVPLPFEPRPAYASTLLSAGQWVQLAGPPGSGRSLALIQLAGQWLQSSRTAPVLIVPLALIDRPEQSPPELLSQVLGQHHLDADLAIPTSTTSELLLLIDGWEELPAARREVWQELLHRLPHLLPATHGVITVQHDTPNWEGYAQVHLGPPDTPLVRLWLDTLLPQHNTAAIMQQLSNQPELGRVRQRIFELALLALTYPRHRLPSAPKQLYARVLEILEAQQITLPMAVPFDLDAPTPDGWFLIGRQMLHCATQAQAITQTGKITALVALEAPARHEVARMLRGTLANPAPLYATLWEANDPQTLAVCLCENPRSAPMWAIRVLERLSDQPTVPPSLYDCRPTLLNELPDLLRLAGNALSDERVARLLSTNAALIGSLRLLQLIDHIGQRPATRWAATDALLRLDGSYAPALLINTPAPDALARAMRFYLLALAGAVERQLLTTPETDNWAAALFDPHVDQTRRTYVAHVLLSSESLPESLRTVALALLPEGAAPAAQAHAVLSRACSDSRAAVRRAALAALATQEPQQALRLLDELLCDPDCASEVQHDALAQVAHWDTPAALALLLRCALSPHLSVLLRLQAVRFIAQPSAHTAARHAALQHIIVADQAPDVVVAAAVRLIGMEQVAMATADVCRLVGNAGEVLLVRQAGLDALSKLGQLPHVRAQVLATLRDVIQREPGNWLIVSSALHALGAIGSASCVQMIRVVLRAELAPAIRAYWQTRVADLEHTPVARWPMLEQPAETQVQLAMLWDQGSTDADLPSSLDDFVAQQVQLIHAAGIAALGTLAQCNTALLPAIRELLLELAQSNPTQLAAVQQLAQLAQLDHGYPLHLAFEPLLRAAHTAPQVRWQIIELLSNAGGYNAVLLSWLEDRSVDPFVRGRIAVALGEAGELSALPTIRRLAEQPDGDTYLRMQAVLALGALADPATESSLLHIISDENAPDSLRGAAAAALPASLSVQMRQWLRDLVRGERLPVELITGVLQTLSRQRNRESLAVLLHYAQHSHPQVATAAMQGLALLEDDSAVPMMLNVAQQHRLEPIIRLQAVATLIHLRGAEYASLLRTYLESGVLSLQLQAFDLALHANPTDPLIVRLLTERSAPLALRLRAAHALSPYLISHDRMHAVLLDDRDDQHLRLVVADLLMASTHPQTTHLLYQCAVATHTPMRLRRHCLAALAARAVARGLADPAALILSELSADPHAAPAQLDQVQRALLELILAPPPPSLDAGQRSDQQNDQQPERLAPTASPLSEE